MQSLQWSDVEMPLSSFVEKFKPPQIVQIGDGAYGEDEETTLSRGEQLIIHLYKDTQCYSGVSETGDEINIPLNSPHELYVHYEKSLEGYETPAKLGSVFPLKYKAVRIKSSLKNASDSSQTIEEGERLKALYFDKEMENLVCLDKQGCEVTFEMNQLSEIRAIERTEDPLFMLEAHQRFSLPFDVQFVQKSNSSAHLPRGIIRLKRIAVRQTIIATSPSEYSKSVLTFPSTLGVTVTPPEDAMLSSPGYKNLCENLKIGGGDLTKVEETIENDNEIYDDVRNSFVKAIPYAEAFFGNRSSNPQVANNNNTGPSERKGSGEYEEMVGVQSNTDEDNYEIVPDMIPPKREVCRNKSSLPPASGITREKKTSVVKRLLKFSRGSNSDTSLKSPTSPTRTTLPRSGKTMNSGSSAATLGSNQGKHCGSDNDSDADEYIEPVSPVQPDPLRRDYDTRYERTRQMIMDSHKKTEDLTVQEIGLLLHRLNLSQYAPQFESEMVDGKMMVDLSKDVLEEHFRMSAFHAHKLRKAVSENWRPAVQ